MVKPTNFAMYPCDVFVDTGPISVERIADVFDAGVKRVVAFAEDASVRATLQERFGREIEAGALFPHDAATPEALAAFFRAEAERCLVWVAPIPGRRDAARIEASVFEALRGRIAAIGEGGRHDHIILVDEVRRLKLLDPTGQSAASVDAVVEEARKLNPDYRIGFDSSRVSHNVLSFSTGVVEQDDVESLAAVLSQPEALAAAALEALGRISAPISELAHHLPNHHARLGEVALVRGQPHLALAFGARAAALAPKTLGHRLLVCEASRAVDLLDVMEEHARAAIMLSPSSPHGYRFLSLALEKAGRFDEAISTAKEAARRGGAARAYFEHHLSGVHRRVGDLVAAENVLRAALADTPESALLKRALGDLVASKTAARGDAMQAASVARNGSSVNGGTNGRAQMIPLSDAADGDALRNARLALKKVAAATTDAPSSTPVTRFKVDRSAAVAAAHAASAGAGHDALPKKEAIDATIDDLGRALDFDLESEMDQVLDRE